MGPYGVMFQASSGNFYTTFKKNCGSVKALVFNIGVSTGTLCVENVFSNKSSYGAHMS